METPIATLPYCPVTPCWLGGLLTVDLADLIPLTRSGRPLGKGWFGVNRTKTMSLERHGLHCENVGEFGHRTGWLNSGLFLVVVDCDVKHGIDGISNFLNAGPVPPTMNLRTKSGGRHYYFVLTSDQAEGRNVFRNRVNILPGVDVRGEGGFVRIYEKDLNVVMVAPNGQKH